MIPRLLFVLIAGALLTGFHPRGSQTLGYLAEHAPLIAIGTVRAAAAPGVPGAAWEVTLERPLKGKPPGDRVTVWLPEADGDALAPGRRVLFFLSPAPEHPLFTGKKARPVWVVEGAEAGAADPALAREVSEILAALGPGRGTAATLRVLVKQAGDARARVREDAAAELERRCPKGCALDAPSRARLRNLAAKAPPGSVYRSSLLRACGDADPKKGERVR
jgi:hypothetical protein